ncbi:MAG: zinc-binding dehydrogenase [Candidatus Krumholzibacteria bacterium]|nr:zinc-binding dehydrogenase [Candidatus Krumholzibacteria bacterium]MDH5268552.1 zinc-binding dehydrogenase [Candidatus Krumholzibacteria bacterium]
MKAIYYERHGGPDVLQYGEQPAPAIGPGRVRIDIHASSLNHIDIFLRRGMPGIKIPFPHIPGCDAAGVVSETGAGVGNVKVGDRVLMDPSICCGQCEFCVRGDASLCVKYILIGEHASGTTCEQIVVPAPNAISIPDSMSFEEAASIPLVFVTAWRMLITRGRLRAGEDVLVLGASAGVGIACIQIARVAGARVFAAASSPEKLELCRELGADVLIDTSREDFARRVREVTAKRGVDVVVDYVGRDTWLGSLKSLARGGRLVTCGATTGYNPEEDLRHIFYRQLEIIGSTTGSRGELMAALKLIFQGRMRPVVGAVYDMKDIAAAHAAMEERRAIGKIAIRIKE